MAGSPDSVAPRPFEAMRRLASNMVVGRLILLVILFAGVGVLRTVLRRQGDACTSEQYYFSTWPEDFWRSGRICRNPVDPLRTGNRLRPLDRDRAHDRHQPRFIGFWPQRFATYHVLLLYAIPQVVLLPLVVMLFGIGPVSKIVFGFSHGIFPVILTTVTGMRSVSPLLLRGAESTGASQWQLIRHVIFPHMVPTVFAGFRLTMTVTLLGVLLAELFVSISGIGYYASVFGQSYDPAPLFALILTLAFMAIMLNEFVSHSGTAFQPMEAMTHALLQGREGRLD